VLPGIALAVLASGELGGPAALVGAAAFGVLTSFVVETLERSGTIERSASIGISFTALFSIGVLIVALAAHHIDLDPECILYGDITFTPLDPLVLGGVDLGPRAFVTLAAVFAIDLAFVVVCWKELVIASFDPALARAQGIPAGLLHYLLMGAVSLTVVGAFESVGSVLVVAMLVVPGATAYLLTDRLAAMLVLAVASAPLSAGLGYGAARAMDLSIAAAMTAAAGALFALALVVAPRQGALARAVAHARLRVRVAVENLVGELLRASERGLPAPPPAALAAQLSWPMWLRAIAVLTAERRGLVERSGAALVLLEAGRHEAARIRAAHRGWQEELGRLGYDREHAHASAHRLEHVAAPDAVAERGE
jgi:manganese/zinc/iron transport system permease protein